MDIKITVFRWGAIVFSISANLVLGWALKSVPMIASYQASWDSIFPLSILFVVCVTLAVLSFIVYRHTKNVALVDQCRKLAEENHDHPDMRKWATGEYVRRFSKALKINLSSMVPLCDELSAKHPDEIFRDPPREEKF